MPTHQEKLDKMLSQRQKLNGRIKKHRANKPKGLFILKSKKLPNLPVFNKKVKVSHKLDDKISQRNKRLNPTGK